MGQGSAVGLVLREGQPWEVGSRGHPLSALVRGGVPTKGDSQVEPGKTQGKPTTWG